MGDLFRGAILWCRGWRWDMDGWLVRARREGDQAHISCEVGFVEEASVAARSLKAALAIDAGLDPSP